MTNLTTALNKVEVGLKPAYTQVTQSAQTAIKVVTAVHFSDVISLH